MFWIDVFLESTLNACEFFSGLFVRINLGHVRF
jgi:hypothetical protein